MVFTLQASQYREPTMCNNGYREQLTQYLRVIGAQRGAVVYDVGRNMKLT
jgi:hypothetical protein